jgi:hypothetical protein
MFITSFINPANMEHILEGSLEVKLPTYGQVQQQW